MPSQFRPGQICIDCVPGSAASILGDGTTVRMKQQSFPSPNAFLTGVKGSKGNARTMISYKDTKKNGELAGLQLSAGVVADTDDMPEKTPPRLKRQDQLGRVGALSPALKSVALTSPLFSNPEPVVLSPRTSRKLENAAALPVCIGADSADAGDAECCFESVYDVSLVDPAAVASYLADSEEVEQLSNSLRLSPSLRKQLQTWNLGGESTADYDEEAALQNLGAHGYRADDALNSTLQHVMGCVDRPVTSSMRFKRQLAFGCGYHDLQEHDSLAAFQQFERDHARSDRAIVTSKKRKSGARGVRVKATSTAVPSALSSGRLGLAAPPPPGNRWCSRKNVPFVNQGVKVLFADGVWYKSRVTTFFAAGPERFHVHVVFDDGTDDWLCLPDPEVQLTSWRTDEASA
jgi:hypothetical protein